MELGVVGDHASEEALEDGIVVHELGPNPRSEAGYMWEPAGPLGTRRKLERHVKAEPRSPDWTLPPAE